MKTVLPILISLLSIGVNVSGQAGLADPAFGSQGLALLNFEQQNKTSENVSKVLLLPDGKSLFAGSISNVAGFIYRFKASAPQPWQWLDDSYGQGGIVYLTGMTISGACLQADGKLVVVGYHFNGFNNDIAVARLQANGSADLSFGSNGRVYTAVGSSDDYGEAVAIQPDGKIVVGGSSSSTGSDFALVRYHTNGTLDVSFDGDGFAVTNFGAMTIDQLNDIAIQPDGKIVAAGYSGIFYPSAHYDFAVARYHSDGSPDNSFDNDGRTTTPVGTGSAYGTEMALQADGKILLTGTGFNGSNDDIALVRYLPGGALDLSFDADGKILTAVGSGNDGAYAITVAGNGSILVAGKCYNGSNDDIAVVKYLSTGAFDNSFDLDGKVVFTVETSPGYPSGENITSLALLPNGQLLMAGLSINGVEGNRDLVNARLNADGSLDAGFSNAISIVGGSRETGVDVAVQPDGKVVVAANRQLGSANRLALTRFLVNGSVDMGFGVGGWVSPEVASLRDEARALALQPDGKIVVVGAGYTIPGEDIIIARYLPDGTPDNSFDGDGKMVLAISSLDEWATSVVVQPDGKILIAGYGENGTDQDGLLVRLLPDGVPDASFGTGGIVRTNFPGYESLQSLALQADGKIIVAGSAQGDFLVARFLSNGSFDTSFGPGGYVTTGIGSEGDAAMDVLIQPDGYVLVAGNSYAGMASAFAAVRYSPAGALDPGFGSGGITNAMPAITTNEVASISLQTDGSILIGGTAFTGTGKDMAVVRLLPNGIPDPAFDSDGIVLIDRLETDDVLGGMRVSGNRLILAGTIVSQHLEDVAVVSLQLDVSTVPVTLLGLRGQRENNQVALRWQAVNEVNIGQYVIERSSDGRSFAAIGKVAADSSGQMQHAYSFTDLHPLPHRGFYRLRIMDVNGDVSFSQIVIVRMAGADANSLLLYPNPARDVIQLTMESTRHEQVRIRLVNALGVVMKSLHYTAEGNMLYKTIDLRGLPAGMYTLVTDSRRGSVSRLLIKR